MTTTETRMSMIFNEWAARYAADPESFGPILDESGKPTEDYGINCTHYFVKIAEEMDAEGKLPITPH
jgi:hypothetical protein